MKLDEMVFQHNSELNENDILIWNYIAEHREECMDLPIEALAKKCLVSRTTILRFSKKIGLSGYSDLKYILKQERLEGDSLSETDVRHICEQNMYTIRILQDSDMTEVCRLLAEADRVFAYGQGFFVKSGMQILKEEMFKADLIINLLNGTGEMETFIRNAKHGDAAIIFSISGENKTTIGFAERAKERGVKLIVITSDTKSALCTYAEAVLNFAPLITQDLKGRYEIFPISTLVFLIELLFYRYFIYQKSSRALSSQTE